MNSTSNGAVSSETKAYYISGHGSEGEDSFIVPEGCMIVVKQEHGNMGYTETVDRDNLELNILKRLPLKVLQQPDVYIEELINSVGPVSIFKPGDVCPNFEYYPLACYGDTGQCHNLSGYIDVGELQKSKDEIFDVVLNSHDLLPIDCIIANISESFNHSLFIKPDDFLSKFEEDMMNKKSRLEFNEIRRKFNDMVKPAVTHVINYVNDVMSRKDDNTIITVSQKRLCEILINGYRKKKGVFYNFVCRKAPNIHRKNLIEYNSSLGKNVPILTSRAGLTEEQKRILNERLKETLGRGRKEGVVKWYEKYGNPTNVLESNTVFGGRRKQSRRRKSRSTKYQRTIKRSKCSLSSA